MIQLLIIALVSFLVGDQRAAIVVAAMLLISVALSIVQEEPPAAFSGADRARLTVY